MSAPTADQPAGMPSSTSKLGTSPGFAAVSCSICCQGEKKSLVECLAFLAVCRSEAGLRHCWEETVQVDPAYRS